MAKINRPRRPVGASRDPVRSVRMSDALWRRFVLRCKYEEVTPSLVLQTFAEGYADGSIGLPRVSVDYSSTQAPTS